MIYRATYAPHPICSHRRMEKNLITFYVINTAVDTWLLALGGLLLIGIRARFWRIFVLESVCPLLPLATIYFCQSFHFHTPLILNLLAYAIAISQPYFLYLLLKNNPYPTTFRATKTYKETEKNHTYQHTWPLKTGFTLIVFLLLYINHQIATIETNRIYILSIILESVALLLLPEGMHMRIPLLLANRGRLSPLDIVNLINIPTAFIALLSEPLYTPWQNIPTCLGLSHLAIYLSDCHYPTPPSIQYQEKPAFTSPKRIEISTHKRLEEQPLSNTQTKEIDAREKELWSEKANIIIEYMEKKQSYLNPNLSLWQVAKETGLSSKSVSKAINCTLGISFSTFVNQYRIAHSKKFLMNKKELNITIDSIALESGFNSRYAFNAAFQKQERMTTTEWIRSQKKKEQNPILCNESVFHNKMESPSDLSEEAL